MLHLPVGESRGDVLLFAGTFPPPPPSSAAIEVPLSAGAPTGAETGSPTGTAGVVSAVATLALAVISGSRLLNMTALNPKCAYTIKPALSVSDNVCKKPILCP